MRMGTLSYLYWNYKTTLTQITLLSLPTNLPTWMVHQMRTPGPRIIVRIDRCHRTRQMRHRTSPSAITPLVDPPLSRAVIIRTHVRRGGALPSIALPKLHVVILTSCACFVRATPLRRFVGADGLEGGHFAGSCAAILATEGEPAGDFGAEVAEEMGHGDEAAADDAGRDLGDATAWSARETRQTWGRQTYVHNATGNR